jgi:hypothetical protein
MESGEHILRTGPIGVVSLDQNQIGAVGSHTVDNMDKQPRHRRVSRADILGQGPGAFDN